MGGRGSTSSGSSTGTGGGAGGSGEEKDYKELKRVKDYNKLNEKMEGQYSKFSKDELQTVREYQVGDYRTYNNYLRHGEKMNKRDSEDLKKFQKVMNGSKLTDDIKVYRGLGNKLTAKIENAKPGTIIKDKGYMSTSLSRSSASTFAAQSSKSPRRVIAEIKVSKGTKAINMTSANKKGGNSNKMDKIEKEVVLNKGTSLKYTGTVRRGSYDIAQFEVA